MFQHRQFSSTSAPLLPTPQNTAVVELRLGPGTRSLGTQEGQAQSRPGWPCLLSHASHQGKQKTWRGARGTSPPGSSLLSCPFPTFLQILGITFA